MLFLLIVFLVFSSAVRADSLMEIRLDKIERILQMEEFLNSPPVKPVSINPHDISEPSYITVEDIDWFLWDTELVGLGHAYAKSEALHDINAVYLMAITILESGYGTSRLAKDKNNISGFSAYDKNPYEDAKYFETKDDCVLITAELLNVNYVNRGSMSIEDINKRYASDSEWSWKVNNIAEKIVEEVNKEKGF